MQNRAGPQVGHAADQPGGGRVRPLADEGGVREAAEERAHAEPLPVHEQVQAKVPGPERRQQSSTLSIAHLFHGYPHPAKNVLSRAKRASGRARKVANMTYWTNALKRSRFQDALQFCVCLLTIHHAWLSAPAGASMWALAGENALRAIPNACLRSSEKHILTA